MSNPRDIAEPSMEEILSSIRRIIAADDNGAAKPATPAAGGVPGLRREPARAEPEPSAQPEPEPSAEVGPNGAATPASNDGGAPTAVLEDEDAAEEGDVDDVLELTTMVEEPAPAAIEPPPAALPADAAPPESQAAAGPRQSAPPQLPEAAKSHEKETQPVSTATANGKTDELVSGGTAAATANAFGKLSQSLRPPAENGGPITGDQRRLEDIVVEALRPMLKSWLDEHLPAIVDRLVQQEISKMARRAELM